MKKQTLLQEVSISLGDEISKGAILFEHGRCTEEQKT